MTRLFTLIGMLILGISPVFSQQSLAEARTKAIRYAQENWQKLGLMQDDVADLAITDCFKTDHNGVTHVWMLQRHHQVPVYNGLFQVALMADGTPLVAGHRWARDMAHKINSNEASVSVSSALEKALQSIDYQGVSPQLHAILSPAKFLFSGAQLGRDLTAELVYQPMNDGRATLANQAQELRLAWSFQIQPQADHHLWAVRVDAVTGEILKKEDLATSCDFGKSTPIESQNYLDKQICAAEKTTVAEQKTMEVSGAAASYNVFALPSEAPNDGVRTVVSDPADVVGSPFGWHDTNGFAGAESTKTKGNNVNAYQDANGDDMAAVPNDQPDGGASLVFNAPYNPDEEPENQSNAGVINLFYMQNMMHDFAFNYGMNGASGAFQTNNYGTGGIGNDQVNAEARDGQFAANPSTNNANFTPSPDGIPGKTQMFIWDRSAAVGGNLKINGPANIVGTVTTSSANGWGAAISTVAVTGQVEIADDASVYPTFACNQLVNNMTGKIALVDRQSCQFGTKALNAQDAGAIACIICNFEDNLLNMAAGDDGGNVNIPVIMIKKSDCDIIRQYAGTTLNVSIVQPTVSGPNALDGDLDNGIIAHEYGHGISNRLVGGPNTASCLSNAEQMGEGISDLMTLFTTARATDQAETPRGIGTYVQREDHATGRGIRRYPYSTSLITNPLTYSDLASNPQVHAVGEIWAVTMWEFYWKMIEKYGFDANIMTGTGGNNKAIQIFFDAMKLAPCSPGFVDLRQAMFAADQANFDGIHKCLIWEAFAKRGLGIDAKQGDSNDAGDQIANFEPLPTCIEELKIRKSSNKDLVNPGEEIKFTLNVVNDKPTTATAVVVTDELPAGLNYIAGSASNGGTFSAISGKVTWALGSMANAQTYQLTYSAQSSTEQQYTSTRQWFDDLEAGDADWVFDLAAGDGSILWQLQNVETKSGTAAWGAKASPVVLNVTLDNLTSHLVTGAQPVLRFWHKYETEGGNDGGFVEISTNNGVNWSIFPKSKYLRRGPFGLAYSTFALADLSAWSGNSSGWVDTYLDLSSYAGQSVNFRWRFGCNATNSGNGWYIDDVELMDLFNFNGIATITSGSGDIATASLPTEGVYVNSTGIIGTNELSSQTLGFRVQPNPASDMLFVSLLGTEAIGESRISILAADGRLLKTTQFDFQSTSQIVPMEVSNLAPGLYFLRVEGAKASGVVKVVIR